MHHVKAAEALHQDKVRDAKGSSMSTMDCCNTAKMRSEGGSVTIIAYKFETDMRCSACTKLATQRMKIDHRHPDAMGDPSLDGHGIESPHADSSNTTIRGCHYGDGR